MSSKFNIKKNLEQNHTILLLVSSSDYNKNIIKIAKKLSSGKVCYVTLNKTYDSLKEIFKKNRINPKNFIFMDCISKTLKKTIKDTKDCIYCSSPGSLTEISISINKVLKYKFDYLIFDSVTNLLIYEKQSPVAKFMSSLINNIKNSKTKGIFYALTVKDQSDLIKKSGMFVDKVINLEKTTK
jgi:KaiC/GvpD/RAD55 family RecA-like ATPase